jgi:hypothetical protein
MKKINYLSFLIILVISFMVPINLSAGTKDNQGKHKNTTMQKITANPGQSLIDINQITCWTRDDGYHDWVVGGSWDGAYPNGVVAGAIFSEGVLWGGFVQDGTTPALRVNGNTYGTGCSPLIRLYRVRPDYATGDLTQDAADFNSIASTAVTDADKQALKDQYAKDWDEWPAFDGSPDGNQGAPYEDVNGDGKYDPAVDIPGIPGASQTLFIKYDDALSNSLYGSPPVGLEVYETYWAYAAAGGLGNVIFHKVDIVYTGTPGVPSDSHIDNMYIVQWADPDVGNSTDDFAGCDTTLNLGYAYSSGYTDAVYQLLNLAPPAVGYDFLQGVSQYTGNPNDSAIFNLKWRHGYAYVNPKPMSSYAYFAAGGTWQDPAFTYTGTLEFYNLMRGYKPDPPYPAGDPFPANVADVTPYGTYLLDGDPVFGTGKIDGTVDGPGDRRIMVTNGPINMQLGDTAEVVLALVGGLGSNNISSISVMKYNDLFAQYAFDQLFDIPIMPKPNVQAFGLNKKIILNWAKPDSLVNVIENQPHGVYTFQGYSVYQLPPGSADITQGVRIATFDLTDTVTVLFDKVLDEGTGLVVSKPIVVLTNTGVQRYLEVDEDQIFNQPLANGLSYTFAVTAMAYNQNPDLPANILESAPAIINVTPQFHAPGVTYSQGDVENVTHQGTADASAEVKVIDPALVTGDQYQVFFDTRTYSLGSDQVWKEVGGGGKKLGKDVTGSYLTSTASWSELEGSMDVHYLANISQTGEIGADGIKIVFPSGVTIDTAYYPISNNDGSQIPFTINRTNNYVFFGCDTCITSDPSSRTGNGKFYGGEDMIVIVHPPTVPMVTNYTIYDDGSDTTGIVDVNGVDTLMGPIADKVVTQKHWNVKDLTTGQVVITGQTILNGIDIYAPELWFRTNFYEGPGGSSHSYNSVVSEGNNPIFDGIQVILSGSYVAPTTIGSLQLNGANLRIGNGGRTPYDITDFTFFGYDPANAANTLPVYGGAGGTSDVNLLQQDYELRWTGVLGDTTVNGVTVTATLSGGQLVTLFGASNYDLADHPLNPNPGSNDPFLVRVPFEVWNLDKNEQVNVLFWDRSGDPTGGGEVWQTADREYLWCVNTEYDDTAPVDPTSSVVADSATWNWVIYNSQFTTGDVITIIYNNPLQIGQDTFTFSTESMAYKKSSVQDEVKMINVFPNPYYGFQYREGSRDQHYVTFSHLPKTATIRIFDLSGVLVRTITHNSSSANSQFDTWNLQNESGYPVASGIYIVYVDMPDFGTTKILKLAVIQEQQILRVY